MPACHFLILFITYGNVKMPCLPFLMCLCSNRWYTCTSYHTYQFQHQRRYWLHRVVWRLYPKRRYTYQRFQENLEHKMHLDDAILSGVISRVRPVVMTAIMAAIGLLPAAMSTGIGSETQKPGDRRYRRSHYFYDSNIAHTSHHICRHS